MKIIINESNSIKELSIIDPWTGSNFITDFLGSYKALSQFDYDADSDVYTCDRDTFDWWSIVVEKHQKFINRVYKLIQEFGAEAVYEALQDVNADEEGYTSVANQALDNLETTLQK